MKTVLKFYDITQHVEEAEFLSSMHADGWKLRSVHLPGIYRFEECTPEKVTYQLDYNKDGITHKDEYIQMFRDCGWEHIQDFVGYSYFRKKCDGTESEDIFCDDESRLEMFRRVFKGRMLPMLVIFFLLIIPQIGMMTIRYNDTKETFPFVMAIVYTLMFVLYLSIFIRFAVKYHHFTKRLK